MENSFYKALYSNEEFTKLIGKLTMSSARLESCIKGFLVATGSVPHEKATLGPLVKRLTDTKRITSTASEHLHFIYQQRNYFVHRLHSNLSEYPCDSLELNDFINRANSLCSEMEFFSEIISKLNINQSNLPE
jgi:hypothetical protein